VRRRLLRLTTWFGISLLAACSSSSGGTLVDGGSPGKGDVGTSHDAKTAIDAKAGTDAKSGTDAKTKHDAATKDAGAESSSDAGGPASPPSFPKSCDFTYYNQGNTTPLMDTLAVTPIGSPPLTDLATSQYIVPMAAGEMAVAEIVAPSTTGANHAIGWAEYAAPAVPRLVYASQTPCDMTASTLVGAAISGTIVLRVESGPSSVAGERVTMQPGQTWFLMFVDSALDDNHSSATFSLPTGEDCVGTNPSCQEIFTLN
jgi:hypothetical protein